MSSRQQQSSSDWYQGVSQSQRTPNDIMGQYPHVDVTNSVPTGTPLQKTGHSRHRQIDLHQTATFPTTHAKHQGYIGDKGCQKDLGGRSGSFPEWLYEMNETTVSVCLCRSLRADHNPQNDPAWLIRAVSLLPSSDDNYLDSLNIDLRNHFEERYTLLAGETFEMNKRTPDMQETSRLNCQCRKKIAACALLLAD